MPAPAPQVTLWPDPPAMDVSVPEPSYARDGDRLWVAYRTHRRDHFAVLRFSGVADFAFEHDSLHAHPLFGAGLQLCAFHEVQEAAARPSGLRHWILTFGDDTLEVRARRAEVIVRAVRAVGADHALAAARA